ncbi:MAG: hypothetical protein LUP91_15060 [Methylococcaceae bacterium]|nr:hypothetical protein [Methylococcaceae bacterium]
MIVTAGQAIQFWCPMSNSGGNCLANDCMWWRWVDPAEHIVPTADMPDAYHSADLTPPRGYCAAAGPIPEGGR